MAHVTDTFRAHEGGSAFRRLAGIRSDLAERFAQFRLFRQTLDELGSLSERELADLGIHRSQIREIATQAAYGT